ncbi:bestrophin family protein [Caballeronia sp. NK8]|uniref:bestrophin family protein n=1 Tax=Caballeronia sp. NK8 TaxID=140098 RepID=UPI001BCBCF16|nr:bestrophin family ion channel [Caballeronia sp. NK8]
MIVRPNQNWLSLLFVWNGSVLQSVIPQLIFMGVVSSLAVFTHGKIFGEKIPLNTTPFTLLGIALAIFLAFRNNESYARFNEARHLWGNILIASRNLASQAYSYFPTQIDQVEFCNLLAAFSYALKHQLRKTSPKEELTHLLPPLVEEHLSKKLYVPVAILNLIRDRLSRVDSNRNTAITRLLLLDAQVSELEKSVGGCERIASTPIPFAYNVLLHRTVYAYCVLLPFGLVDSTEFFTPLLCVFISYTLMALEAIASEVADPFSDAPNALALDCISRNIERSLCEIYGRELPDEIKPRRPYLFT